MLTSDPGMPSWLRPLLSAALLALVPFLADGQDLSPRAYLITPVHSNAVNVTYSFQDGDIILGNAVPIEGATGRIDLEIFSIYYSLRFFGRAANFAYILPYAVGNFRGR